MIPLIMSGQNKLEGKIFDADDKDELDLPEPMWSGQEQRWEQPPM